MPPSLLATSTPSFPCGGRRQCAAGALTGGTPRSIVVRTPAALANSSGLLSRLSPSECRVSKRAVQKAALRVKMGCLGWMGEIYVADAKNVMPDPRASGKSRQPAPTAPRPCADCKAGIQFPLAPFDSLRRVSFYITIALPDENLSLEKSA